VAEGVETPGNWGDIQSPPKGGGKPRRKPNYWWWYKTRRRGPKREGSHHGDKIPSGERATGYAENNREGGHPGGQELKDTRRPTRNQGKGDL